MNQSNTSEEVQNIVLFKRKYKCLVQQLVLIRKNSGCTQELMAEFLKVDKRKIISFEKLKKVELEILLKYSDVLSTDVTFNYQIN